MKKEAVECPLCTSGADSGTWRSVRVVDILGHLERIHKIDCVGIVFVALRKKGIIE